MARKQNKGVRVWIPSDTARMLELAKDKFGFAEGDESALIAMLLSLALSGQQVGSSPATPRSIDSVATVEPQSESVADDELDIDFDDFDLT